MNTHLNISNYASVSQLMKNGASFISKIAFTMMATILLSCGEKEYVDPIIDICPPYHPCQNEPAPGGACTPDTYVTVSNVACGVGVWGSYWLQLDNGDYLQPWASNNTDPVQPGQRFRISYAPIPPDGRYDSVVTCMATVPVSTPIRINCMEFVSNPF